MTGMIKIRTIEVSAASTVQVNDVFSADYFHYEVTFAGVGSVTAGDTYLRFSVGGTPYAGTDYDSVRFLNQNSLSTTEENGATRARLGRITAEGNSATHAYIAAPFATQATIMFTESAYEQSSNTTWVRHYYDQLVTTTSYDGFEFFCDSGTFTGRIAVYGLTIPVGGE